MSANPIILDVAVLPMLIFNPVVLLMLALAVGFLILSVIKAKRRRRQSEEQLSQNPDEPAKRNQQDPKP